MSKAKQNESIEKAVNIQCEKLLNVAKDLYHDVDELYKTNEDYDEVSIDNYRYFDGLAKKLVVLEKKHSLGIPLSYEYQNSLNIFRMEIEERIKMVKNGLIKRKLKEIRNTCEDVYADISDWLDQNKNNE